MDTQSEDALILIVDDVARNIQVAGTALREHGYRIIPTSNSLQVVPIAEKACPDLILLDISMPEIDGFEVCRRLKANPKTQDIPVVFLTARTETQDIVKGFELGGVDYLTKPFNSAELLARIRTHISITRLRQDVEEKANEVARLQREQEAFLRHELNNRIMPVHGYTQLLLQYKDRYDEASKDQMLLNIYNGAQSVITLIDSLRALQDIERSKTVAKKVPMGVKVLVMSIVEDLRLMFDNKVPVTVEDSMLDDMLCAEPTLLDGVFRNLIKNAMEHVVEGETEEEKMVTVALSGDAKQIVFSVHNGGKPIPEDKQATFFDKFNTDKSQKQGGTGLGTTYAKLVTEAHGGEISVSSNPSTGTTVVVCLPRE